MRTLHLHVGHGKTGSSFIQASLAASIDVLRKRKVVYPVPPSRERALKGGITTGNGPMLDADRAPFDLRDRAAAKVLFSSELLFGRILGRQGEAMKLEEVARRCGADRVEILLFIRNPIEHLCSTWQQRIKRSGETMSIDLFSKRFFGPRLVLDFLDVVEPLDFVTLTVRNYSRVRGELLAVVEDWLGVPRETLVRPPVDNVNRSMTYHELELQRLFNARLGGPCGAMLSDRLCEEAPEIAADEIRPVLKNQQRAIERLRPVLEAINARIPPEARYDFDVAAPRRFKADDFRFSRRQIEIIVEGLADEIERRRVQRPVTEAAS